MPFRLNMPINNGNFLTEMEIIVFYSINLSIIQRPLGTFQNKKWHLKKLHIELSLKLRCKLFWESKYVLYWLNGMNKKDRLEQIYQFVEVRLAVMVCQNIIYWFVWIVRWVAHFLVNKQIVLISFGKILITCIITVVENTCPGKERGIISCERRIT